MDALTSTSTTTLAMKTKVRLKANSSSRDTERQPPSLQASTAGQVQVSNTKRTHAADTHLPPRRSHDHSSGHMTTQRAHRSHDPPAHAERIQAPTTLNLI